MKRSQLLQCIAVSRHRAQFLRQFAWIGVNSSVSSAPSLSRAVYARLFEAGFPDILDRNGAPADVIDTHDSSLRFDLKRDMTDALQVSVRVVLPEASGLPLYYQTEWFINGLAMTSEFKAAATWSNLAFAGVDALITKTPLEFIRFCCCFPGERGRFAVPRFHPPRPGKPGRGAGEQHQLSLFLVPILSLPSRDDAAHVAGALPGRPPGTGQAPQPARSEKDRQRRAAGPRYASRRASFSPTPTAAELCDGATSQLSTVKLTAVKANHFGSGRYWASLGQERRRSVRDSSAGPSVSWWDEPCATPWPVHIARCCFPRSEERSPRLLFVIRWEFCVFFAYAPSFHVLRWLVQFCRLLSVSKQRVRGSTAVYDGLACSCVQANPAWRWSTTSTPRTWNAARTALFSSTSLPTTSTSMSGMEIRWCFSGRCVFPSRYRRPLLVPALLCCGDCLFSKRTRII